MIAEPTPVRLSGDLCAAMPIGTELVGCEGYWKGASYVKTTPNTWCMFHKRPTPEQVWEAVEGRKSNLSPHPSGSAYVYEPPAKPGAPIDPSKVKAGDTVTLTNQPPASATGVVEKITRLGIVEDPDRATHWEIVLRSPDGAFMVGPEAPYWTLADHQPAPAPEPSIALTIPVGPKMLRETLCAAQAGLRRSDVQPDRTDEHVARLESLIEECDRHRPLGPDGKHGQRHTPTCGCDDVPERYRPEPVPDDAEALRRELRHLQAKVEGYEFGEATTIKLLRAEVERLSGDWRSLSEEVRERWASLSRAEAIRQAEQLSSSLKAQFAANEELRQKVIARGHEREAVASMLGVSELSDQAIHDAIKELQAEVDRLRDALDAAQERARIANRDARDEHAEVERLRAKTLPTDLTKCICPWDSEDRGGGHSEIVAEYEPACPVHSEHVYDPRQGMWVERSTLPKRLTVTKAVTREEFATALAQHYGDHESLAAVPEQSTRQNYLSDADALLAILGGAE